MLDLNQAIVFRERCIQTQEDLLQQLANREQEVQDPATDCEDEKEADVKNEVDVGKLVLPLPPDELDDPFEEVEEYEYFEEFGDLDGLEEANDVEVGEEVAHDAESLVSSVQKEFESIYNDESTEDNKDFTEDPSNYDEIHRIVCTRGGSDPPPPACPNNPSISDPAIHPRAPPGGGVLNEKMV